MAVEALQALVMRHHIASDLLTIDNVQTVQGAAMAGWSALSHSGLSYNLIASSDGAPRRLAALATPRSFPSKALVTPGLNGSAVRGVNFHYVQGCFAMLGFGQGLAA